MRKTKRFTFIATLLMLVTLNCCVVYAVDASNDNYAQYDGKNVTGHVHSFIVESGWGNHSGNACVEIYGRDAYALGEVNCGTQLGGTGVWDKLDGTKGVTRIYKQRTGRFTYVNAWLQVGNEYIDAPVGQ